MAQFVCKYCGTASSSVAGLTNGSCSKNPAGGRHVPYEGSTTEKKYACMYCGQQNTNIASLTGGSCSKNPSSKKFHVPHG